MGARVRWASLDHRHDLRQQGLTPHTLGAHHEPSRAVHGAAGDAVVGPLLHRNGLARYHRFIHRTRAVDNAPIHRNLLAGAHAQAVAAHDLVQGNVLFPALGAQPAGRLRRQSQQSLQGAARAAAGLQFQHLPQKDQGDDRGSGFKVHRNFAGREPE